ncbi:MAG: TolC family protein, partial [Puniceicoccales bacterium]
ISSLFDNWSANFLAGLTQPLFDAGQRQAEVERQLALAQQALLQYRTTVLTAYKEVRDAFVQEEWYYAELAAMDSQITAAEQEFNEAQSRYTSGLTDYLDVTSSLSSLQALQRERIALLANLLQSRINLHLALGGEFPLTNPDPSPILSTGDSVPLAPAITEFFEEEDSEANPPNSQPPAK